MVIPAVLVGRNFSAAQNQFLFTTLGKLIFNQILPTSFPSYVNDLKEYNEENSGSNGLIELNQIEKK